MKFLIVLLLALAACETDMDAYMFEQFQKFITKYEKKYSSIKEYLARFEVFRRNIMQTLQENNSYTTGVTKFSDLTLQEFKRTYLNLNYDAMAMANFDPYYVKETNAAPASWDWRSKGLVSAVKNQGSCGSCWAFSAMANLEGLYFKGRGRMEILAEQMLVDCDPYNHGCNGGFMEYSFTWLKENGGVMRQSDYPYTARKGSCQSNPSKFIDMKITGFTKLGSSSSSMYSYVDEGQIKEAIKILKDDEYRKKLGKEARDSMAKHTNEIVLKKWTKLLSSVYNGIDESSFSELFKEYDEKLTEDEANKILNTQLFFLKKRIPSLSGITLEQLKYYSLI